jgi:hypothetical protein
VARHNGAGQRATAATTEVGSDCGGPVSASGQLGLKRRARAGGRRVSQPVRARRCLSGRQRGRGRDWGMTGGSGRKAGLVGWWGCKSKRVRPG